MLCAYDTTRNSDRAADRLIQNNNSVVRLLPAVLGLVFGTRRKPLLGGRPPLGRADKLPQDETGTSCLSLNSSYALRPWHGSAPMRAVQDHLLDLPSLASPPAGRYSSAPLVTDDPLPPRDASFCR